ncbi:recombination-associated protein RdgC [Candidatus Methylomicrobium oryzae]|uniref:recombination-associated protein RdgC n=1 Tax=Candidatus Methylomicrobium oryzae TaxID=2802053 RepID=UPI00192447AD|nr:recombination-associated protein RdgC [Methylomicrobium sp. RS1]MBL1262205.1 recombination-associated protein RdgC [Methylomicrobium sp. RS1]
MWFKNLTIFRLTEAFTLTPGELEQKLQTLQFRSCGPHEEFSFGWTQPIGKSADQRVHAANGFMMLCGKKEEKVLPTAVVNEMLQEKIGEIEDREARKLSKKERTTLKDELIFELLPKAFRFSRKTYAYIDPKGGWLLIDSASAKSAEDLLSNLRKCLGSLPAIPLNTIDKPSVNMTQWLLTQETPEDLTIEDECELRALQEEGGIIRCKKHDLSVPEIKNHLDTGKQVIKLAVNWAGRIAFVLDEHLALKRLRFLDMVQEQAADIDTGSAAERFDADFTIMTGELAELLPRLTAWFGGENRT